MALCLAAPLVGALNLPPLAPAEPVQAFWRRDASALSSRLQDIIAHAPSLQQPEYRPTPWARASKANFAVATVRSRLGMVRRRLEPPFQSRTTVCDEPDVVVEWTKDPVSQLLPDDAPIVIFLHTITGTAAQTRWLKKYASQRGWRSCTFVRRGHGGTLHSPSFNLLGAVEDVEQQLKVVRESYPNAGFLGMVGVSAGSAQLISYLGRAGESTPIGAACAVCPAWDVPTAFGGLGATEPAAERAMVRSIQAKFLGGSNEQVLREWDADAFERCRAATTLPELMEAHAPFAMRQHGATAEDYYRAHDPMSDRKGLAVPTLLLNAEDDFVCPASLARPDVVVSEQPGALLLLTRSGSHVAFNEGLFARGAFHMRISFDFLDAALATAPPPAEPTEDDSSERASDKQQQELWERTPQALTAALGRSPRSGGRRGEPRVTVRR